MKALITGCLGDLLDVTKWLTDQERSDVDTILWATPQQGATAETIVGRWLPSVKSHVRLWPDWSGRPRLYVSADHVARDLEREGRILPPCADWSVETIFGDTTRLWNGHEIFTRLPTEDYWAVQAFSSHDSGIWRDFSDDEWCALLEWLVQNRQRAVVVGTGPQFVPDHPRILNRVNQTTILEAVDIVRAAKGAIAVDSFFASLAAPLFDHRHLAIRIRSTWPTFYLRSRYSPHPAWPFVGNDLRSLLHRLEV